MFGRNQANGGPVIIGLICGRLRLWLSASRSVGLSKKHLPTLAICKTCYIGNASEVILQKHIYQWDEYVFILGTAVASVRLRQASPTST
jgi:hypothetical protein